MNNKRCYSELIKLPTFIERYNYLRLSGKVGDETFGFDRYLNQELYCNSREWHNARRTVILRDNGCDLGIEGRDINKYLFIHHMNPLTKHDIEILSPDIFNPEFLICCSMDTHNAIHYGDESLLVKGPIVRFQGDTKLW